jgi:trichothecene 3-O-acetyltransferase
MASIQPTRILKLTPLDLIMPPSYTRLLLSFPFPDSSSVKALTDFLQIGVDHIVSQMPFLAGTICVQEDGLETGRSHVVYPVDSAKVHLQVLELPSHPHTYSDLCSANMPPGRLENRFAPVSAFADPLNDPCPVFAIQATFIPGGLFLCVSVHHYIMDGTGFGTLLGLLAESCRTAGTSLYPNIDRIQERATCMIGLSDKEMPKTHLEYKIVDLSAQVPPQSTPPALPPMKTIVFCFSAPSLARLKADLTRHIPTEVVGDLPSFISTNDCLTALLWACITRARLSHLDTSTTKASRLGMAVNGRRQLIPPLAQAHLSNVNIFATTSLPIETLTSSATEDLAIVARSIRQAITAIDVHHIRSAISLISGQHNIKSVQYGFQNFLGPDLAVTSWEGMGAYGHDWGCGLGRPEWVRPVPSDGGFDGLAIVFPRKIADGEGSKKPGLEVMIGLRKDDMDKLESDDLWKSYCDATIS